MTKSMTNEFSICLLPDKAITDAFAEVRGMMPASPYRDDPPHYTFIRTLRTPQDMTDEELVGDMKQLLAPEETLPLKAKINSVANRRSPRYGLSAVALLKTSPELRSYRRNIVHGLLDHGYTMSRLAKLTSVPHMSLKLGAPIAEPAKSRAIDLLRKTCVTFGSAVLFRVMYEDDTRLMHELYL